MKLKVGIWDKNDTYMEPPCYGSFWGPFGYLSQNGLKLQNSGNRAEKNEIMRFEDICNTLYIYG